MTASSPRPDILEHIVRSLEFTSYENAKILEIGGDRWDAFATAAVGRGAEHVTTINISPGWPELQDVNDSFTKRKVDANFLSQVFPAAHFDFCFGIAILEHVPRHWLMLEEIARVLKPGGIVYLHGGPIWTSAKGHHLFTQLDGKWYRFSDPDCPIRNWEHLIYDADELADVMAGRGLDPDIARSLADWIHTTTEQNRYGYKRIEAIFESCGMVLLQQFDNAFNGPRAEIEQKIRLGPWGDEARFDVMGVTYVLQKSGDV